MPTGNFGNILAGFIAAKMGLPVNRFICASNKNNVLTDFFATGVYDRNREFFKTVSPSMDILISSNLERLLYFFAGAEKTRGYMASLNEKGRYAVDADTLSAICEYFDAGYTDEEGTASRIKAAWRESGRLIDTHTAVALDCAKRLGKPGEKIVTVSTASAYKFAADVTAALGGEVKYDRGTLSPLYSLSELTKTEIPAPLAALAAKKIRFSGTVEKEEMPETLFGD